MFIKDWRWNTPVFEYLFARIFFVNLVLQIERTVEGGFDEEIRVKAQVASAQLSGFDAKLGAIWVPEHKNMVNVHVEIVFPGIAIRDFLARQGKYVEPARDNRLSGIAEVVGVIVIVRCRAL